MKQITFPFDTLISVLDVSEILQKNSRPEPFCLVSLQLRPCSISQGYSLSLKPVNQQRKHLAVRVYFRWYTIRSRAKGFRLTKNWKNSKSSGNKFSEMIFFFKNRCLLILETLFKIHFMTYSSKVMDGMKVMDERNSKIACAKPLLSMLSGNMQHTHCFLPSKTGYTMPSYGIFKIGNSVDEISRYATNQNRQSVSHVWKRSIFLNFLIY